ncbi:DUF6444 domain-containing protein [Candidatus Accumulibacter necessarius]|uniref:DUF6444 domain-containing protein n=1 Tax=Candidatus Accumulibacter necessarius TaxID=2954386 RepID=UPI003DA9ED6C
MRCIGLSVVDPGPARLAIHLTDHDLRQLDRDALSRIGEEALRPLAERLVADLKDAPDRLNQHSRNSSRPPGSNSVYRQPRGASARDPPTDTAPDEPPTARVDTGLIPIFDRSGKATLGHALETAVFLELREEPNHALHHLGGTYRH